MYKRQFQGILETSGYFCLVFAYAFDKASIAVVISSGFGLVTVVLARLILKEQISKLQSVGIILTFWVFLDLLSSQIL